jgi:hypothetical protein
LSQDAEVGVKWKVQRGWLADHARTELGKLTRTHRPGQVMIVVQKKRSRT